MRVWRSIFALVIAAAAFLMWTAAAGAVIKVDFPVSKIYDASRQVVVGTVASVNPANRVLEVKVADTAKGEAAGDVVRVQVVSPAELAGQAAPGGSVVLFVAKEKGGTVALAHLADTWLMAEAVPGAKPPAWRVVGPHDAKQSFPGRTAALARLVGELKAGKSTLIDTIDPTFFRGGVREIARLKVSRPAFLSAADVTGDKRPDLLVGTAEGVRLFISSAAGFEDATDKRGLAGAGGACRALGDVNADGKTDLLLGGKLWINDGQKFIAARTALELPAGAATLAADLADVNGDKKPDALILLADGRMLVFENPGATDKPWPPQPVRTLWQGGAAAIAAAIGDWGDNGKPAVMVVRENGVTRYALDADGGPPADYERLTGKAPGSVSKGRPEGLKGVAVAAVDANGDGRPDLVLAAEGWSLLMLNRGFGTYLDVLDACEAATAKEPGRVPFKLSASTVWTAADMRGDGHEDLLVLTEDGRLYDVVNAK